MSFAATHVVPASGLPTWPSPDPSASQGPQLDGGLDVQLLEVRPDGWAQVACSNGWTAWVDGRALSVGVPAAASVGEPQPVSQPTEPAAGAPAKSMKMSKSASKIMAVFVVVILVGLRILQMAHSSVSPDTAKTASKVGIVLMALMLAMSLRGAKVPARVRTPFEIGRALC